MSQAYSTDARVHRAMASRSRERWAMIAPSGMGKPVSPSHQFPRSTRRESPYDVGEARFVDNQSGVDRAVSYRRHDFVKWHHHNLAHASRYLLGRPQPKQQIGGRAFAWHRNPPAGQYRRVIRAVLRQHQRPAASAERAAAR